MENDARESNAIAAIEAALLNTGLLAFSGEMQLLDWSKSTSREPPKIKFALTDDESLSPFEVATTAKGKKTGQLYHVFVIPVSDDAITPESSAEKKPRTPNYLARQLHQSGFFRRVTVWDKMNTSGLYTHALHHAHVSSQPCFFCKGLAGNAARVSASPWLLLPVCPAHTDALESAQSNITEMARVHALSLVEDGVKSGMKHALGIESLSELTPDLLKEFNSLIGEGL